MKEFTVSTAESGQKCISFCKHILPKAQNGFLYKMLRKKNISVNGKKADPQLLLQSGDVVRFFFSDETFEMLHGDHVLKDVQKKHPGEKYIFETDRIIYEDDNILIYNKPAGLLSEKAEKYDISANELFLQYLQESGYNMQGFTPSVVNRLDRNTSGLLLFGKSYAGSRVLSGLLYDRSLIKLYRCFVIGEIKEASHIEGYLIKDEKNNIVKILKEASSDDASYIETEYTPIRTFTDGTLPDLTELEVHLITGKPHQIRAHMASIQHPGLGDQKYGQQLQPKGLIKSLGIKRQLLHAYKIIFPDDMPAPLDNLSGRSFGAPPPENTFYEGYKYNETM